MSSFDLQETGIAGVVVGRRDAGGPCTRLHAGFFRASPMWVQVRRVIVRLVGAGASSWPERPNRHCRSPQECPLERLRQRHRGGKETESVIRMRGIFAPFDRRQH